MSASVCPAPMAATSGHRPCRGSPTAGIGFNSFHTTPICSPTRASLLTGRNHQRVGAGTIAERAVDWDGYVGVIPKTSATVAETLRHYGYKTAAFGKWHNTPADQTTAMGPFDRWPTGHGFDYFYGFVAGETSQWEPRLYENTTPIEPPHERQVSPERRSRRQGGWLAQATSRLLARQALPHVLGARRRSWPAPDLQGVGRQVQRQVRRRLGRHARAHLQAPEGAWLDSRRHQIDAARRFNGFVGQHSRKRTPVPAPADGDFRRLRRARRRAGRQGDRRARARGRARQHADLLHLRRQRLERRGPERLDQRAAGPEPDPQHRPAADRGAEQDRRPRRARLAEDRQHVSRRLGVGRRYAVPAHQADRLAFRRNTQPDGHLVAQADQARPHPACPVPSRERHRADHLRGRRHQSAEGRRRLRAGPDRRHQPGLHVRRREGRGPARTPSTSTTTAAAPSTATAGSPRPSDRSRRGSRSAPGSRPGTRARTSGNSTTYQGLLAGRQPCGQRSRSGLPG